MTRNLPGLLLAMVCLVTTGCRSVPEATNPMPVADSAYRQAFEASRLTLLEQGFRLDRVDYRFGRITSHPVGSPTVFEPWYDDNSTLEQAAAATLHDERRVARVLLEPDHTATRTTDVAPARYLLHVEVQIERRQLASQHMTGSTRGPLILGQLDEAPKELRDRGIEETYWTAVSRDTAMEQRIAAAIEAAMNRPVAAATATDGP